MAPRRPKSLARRARKWADRAVLSAVNGFVYATEGAARPGKNSAASDLVLSRGKLRLERVRPIRDVEYELGPDVHRISFDRHPTPLMLIPPLMVRPYVYDLRPEHSMVRTLRNAGFDVFVVDFGVPDRHDEQVRLDDYVLDYVPACVDAALGASGAQTLTLAGYCMGGIFSLMHAATHRDARVRNIVTIGAPVNFTKMRAAYVASRIGALGIGPLMDVVGNVPGKASSLGFKLMSGARALTKWGDFVANLDDEGFVRSFDAVNTWVNDLIPYPKEAFKQMVREVVSGNRLIRGGLSFGDKPCELSAVTQPLLAFAGRSDNIATPQATAAIIDLVASTDKSLVPVSGGHVGVVAGSAAPEEVWQPMIDWLLPRSRRPA
ncbi:MAG: alpha/beta fold hydrolase [Myxococcales bacterium]|nr:alpha/beta fold hydrolase [Myxococcales bacterium]